MTTSFSGSQKQGMHLISSLDMLMQDTTAANGLVIRMRAQNQYIFHFNKYSMLMANRLIAL
jgi:hypothetical protein